MPAYSPASPLTTCQIDARLRDGKPALEIIDASDGHVRMAWCSRNRLAETTPDDLKSLFRDLMLLSTIEELALYPVPPSGK